MAVKTKKDMKENLDIIEDAIEKTKKRFTIKTYVIEILKFLGIANISTFVWRSLEVLMTGSVTPSEVDTIIVIILVTSLYVNLKVWENK